MEGHQGRNEKTGMKRRLLYLLLCAGLAAVVALTAFTLPASAEKRTLTVKLLNGQIVTLTLDLPPGVNLGSLKLPGVLEILSGSPAPAPAPTPTVPGGTPQTEATPTPGPGGQQGLGGKKDPSKDDKKNNGKGGDQGTDTLGGGDTQTGGKRSRPKKTKLRNTDGSPAHVESRIHGRTPGSVRRPGCAELRDPEVPGADLPVADLSGGGYPVRRSLGGVGRDQRDRDRLWPQPQRVLRRRAGVDAVHPFVVEDVWGRCEQGRQEGSVQPC